MQALEQQGPLEGLRSVADTLLIALDGTLAWIRTSDGGSGKGGCSTIPLSHQAILPTRNRPSPTDLLRARYGSSTFKPEHLWNETLASLLSHRSVRADRPDALPPQTLETLVAAAQSAATSSNLQTWSVVAVEDPLRKDMLAQLAGNQAHIRQCHCHFILRV